MATLVPVGSVVSEFAGGFPDVPLAAGIDLTTLEAGDGAPFFVTLPIIPEIGTVSASGLLYDEELAAAIEEQIKLKRPGANFGHLAEDDREVAFPHPKAFWVGALRVGNTLWAKCYVPAGEAREHLRNLKAVGGRIATSIFGRGDFEKVRKGVQRLTNFALETVDFAPPERAALGYAAPVIVTAEMETGPDPDGTEQEQEMSEIVEMAQVSETLKAQIIAEYEAASGQARTVAELTQARDAAVAELATVREQLRQRAVVEVRRSIKDRVRELSAWQVVNATAVSEVEAFRRTVVEFAESRVGESTDLLAAKQTVDSIWSQMQPIAELMRDKLAGPPAIVNGRVARTLPNGVKPLEDTPEARTKAAAAMGIAI